MIVLSEASARLTPSASTRDLVAVTEAARLLGCRVYHIPQDFSLCETAENALAHVPVQEEETPGLWVGYIPTPAHYRAIYEAAKHKRVLLLNTPEEHQTAMELDRAYPHLAGLTPESLVLDRVEQCEEAVAQLGLPLFVKGAVQSVKAQGFRACVAETLPELQERVAALLALPAHSRGRVIARRLVRLRHTRSSGLGFPLGREFRVFFYRRRLLQYGYYWEGDDPLKNLSSSEEAAMLGVAREAAARMPTPYLAVDVGQLEDGRWLVIEVGDAQFSGLSETPLLALLNALIAAVSGG